MASHPTQQNIHATGGYITQCFADTNMRDEFSAEESPSHGYCIDASTIMPSGSHTVNSFGFICSTVTIR